MERKTRLLIRKIARNCLMLITKENIHSLSLFHKDS